MENDGIRVYEFEHFKQDPHIVHGVFTRSGGMSKGVFDSLNIGLESGDEQLAIASNRKLIIRKMGMKPLIFLKQVHGDAIKILKKENNDLSEIFEPGKESYAADGIITDMKGIFLVIQVADCQSVMLHDPVKEVIANVHSGWRGSVANIAGQCIDKMAFEFGCLPENIQAGISPSLGPCCAEFIHFRDEIPAPLWKYKHPEKDYFDFWAMTQDQLMEKGVKRENIQNMEICTKCHTDEFYSYRGEKTTGRFACVISMI